MAQGRSTENLRVIYHSFEGGDRNAFFLPAIYQIEPTSQCNLECVMCPNHKITKKGHFGLETFRRLLDEVGDYALGIRLNYLGEPLLHPNIIEMIKYAKAHSEAKVTLFTNATLLTHRISVDLVTSGLDEIVFSIDGATPSTFERVRRLSKYEDVVRNVEHFLLFKDGRKPHASVNFVRLKSNSSELEAVKGYWSKYDCEVHSSRLYTWSAQLDIDTLSSDQEEATEDVPHPFACADLWYKAVVNANCDVLFCCNDYLSLHSFGNIEKQSMWDIWNSQAARAARANQTEQRLEGVPLCTACRNWSTIAEIQSYIGRPGVVVHRP